MKVLADGLPMGNSLFRAYRYGPDDPLLEGKALVTMGSITGDAPINPVDGGGVSCPPNPDAGSCECPRGTPAQGCRAAGQGGGGSSAWVSILLAALAAVIVGTIRRAQ